MLSGVWATNICSLLEGTTRNMMTLYINLLNDGRINYNFYISEGKITKNYNYDNSFKLFRNYFNKIEIIYNYFMKETGHMINEPIIINDTHKFIEALMIIYNLYFGNVIMNSWSYRLLRIQKNKKYDIDLNNYDKDLRKFMFIISNTSANYIITKDLEKHDTIGVYGYTHATSPIRRKVDLINQMLYYNKDVIKYGILEGIIADINRYEKKIKRLNRDINKLYLLERVYNSPNYNTNCYIYSSNIEKNRMSLYFPKERLSFKINIIRNEVKDIVDISKYENRIIIKEKANNNQKEIELYKLLKVCINGIPLIDKIDEMLMIEFL
jgi:exoribonuclease R